MSKKILVTLLALSAFAVAATSAFATTIITATPATDLHLTGYTLSTNSKVCYKPDTNNANYGASVKNKAGNKIFGVTDGFPSIAWMIGTAGDDINSSQVPDPPHSQTDSTLSIGWKTQ